jgi:hypothetical protein
MTGNGALYQLSQVYSNYGYEPKNGPLIPNNQKTLVTGSQHRIYYTRPKPDATTSLYKVGDSFAI